MTELDNQRWVCGRCGYDLSRPTSKRCPECGALVSDVRSPRDKRLDKLAGRGTLLAVVGCGMLVIPPIFLGISIPAPMLIAHGIIYGLYLLSTVVLSLVPAKGLRSNCRRFSTLAWTSAGMYTLIGLMYGLHTLTSFSLVFIPALGLIGLGIGFILIAQRYAKRAAWLYPEGFGD